MSTKAFWHKPLNDLTHEQWEMLCDQCGKCCLNKLEDDETGNVYYTDVACQLLDIDTARCTDYAHRRLRVSACLKLTPETLPSMYEWLPTTCAYRLRADGESLPNWHPLLTMKPLASAYSVASRVISEREVSDDELETRLVLWVNG